MIKPVETAGVDEDDPDTKLLRSMRSSASTAGSPAIRKTSDPDAPWWSNAVGYQVYLRSFQDSTGDGVGDLDGVRMRLDYLADLGVDAVWITPFYPSPQADHGYDVADYLGVDPTYGTLETFDCLVAEAHERGVRVVIDLVPNHTSNRHPWFIDSASDRSARRRDYYLWRDASPDGGPPNNWVSYFGGPAWTYHEATGQYYLHLFLPEQPDLNWDHPAVRDEFDAILRFWLDRGVDGIRIDVAHALVKHPSMANNPPRSPAGATAGAVTGQLTPQQRFEQFEHRFDLDQPGVLEVYRRWRQVADEHDAMLLGEVYLHDAPRVAKYVRGDGLHTAFCFDALRTGWSAQQIEHALRSHLDASGPALAWPLSSHDDPRAATRFGGGRRGAHRAIGYLTLLCGLPGSVWILQGDELGLDDAAIPEQKATDPVAIRNPGATGRDGMRAPMLWAPQPGYGFTTATPWLPFGDNRRDDQTVEMQAHTLGSTLARVKALFHLRRELRRGQTVGAVNWRASDEHVIAYEVNDAYTVALHVGNDAATTADRPARLRVRHHRLVYATDPRVGLDDDGVLLLPADSAAIVLHKDQTNAA